ncbi:MAG: acyltransferase [Acetobacteraceae bacterium]
MTYLPALTSLRFFAAAMIVIHHTQGIFGYGASLYAEFPLDQGVSFFFVLSGFILFYTNRHITNFADARRFLIARMARIWPLHAAMLVLTVLFVPQPWGPGTTGPRPGPLLANLMLVQAWVPLPRYFFAFNTVSWSLSAELFFYLCFPALAIGWRRSWPWKLALCAAATALMIGISSASGLGFYDGSPGPSIDALVYIHPMARLFEFALGILAAHVWLTWRASLDRLPTWAATLFELGALALTIAAMPRFRAAAGDAYAHGVISASLVRWLVATSSGPFFAIVTIAFAVQRGWLSALLARRPLVLLGEISFALYMCHEILLRALTVNGTIAAFGPLLWQYVTYWTMTLGLSYALFRLVEWPCRRAILSAMKVRKQPLAEPTAAHEPVRA